MHFLDPAHTMPEFVSHVLASCGFGLAGIVGAYATRDVRAVVGSERREKRVLDMREDIARFRRRKELGEGARPRDWDDVVVDRHENVVVVQEEVPEFDFEEDGALKAFDRLLLDSPAAQRAAAQRLETREAARAKRRMNNPPVLPSPDEYDLAEDEF